MNQFAIASIVLIASFLVGEKDDHKVVNKAALARQVYARLLRTIGNPADAPVLQLMPRNKTKTDSLVVYRPGNQARIDMGAALLDVCFTFGPDAEAALACLLGHELGHFQYRHGEKQGFSPVIMTNNTAYSSTNLEALADKSGVFMAYLAGYDAFTIAPAVYAKVYDAFELHEQLSGYPSRTQRLKMVSDTTARVRELAQLFEIGEISYLMHDYDTASSAFVALVARYPSAVTLNNLGVIKLNQALLRMKSARDEPRIGFKFPIEFDTDNRLLASSRRGDPLPYIPLLTDAVHLFQTARADQPSHQSARLNEAIAYYLLDQSGKAHDSLTTHQPLTPNARLMLAIVQADLRQPQLARQDFQRAVLSGAFRAAENARFFEESQKPGWITYFNGLAARWQNPPPSTKPAPPMPAVQLPVSAWQSLPLPNKARYIRTDSLTMYELPLTLKKETRLYRVLKSHRLSLRGLPLGSNRSLLSLYKTPASVTAGERGNVLYGYQQGTTYLFLEYRQDRLIGWTYITS